MPKNQGFTIIELLVVVTIIGLLASVVLSSLQISKRSARESATFSTMIQIKKALEVYAVSYGQYPKETEDYDATSFANLFDGEAKFDDFIRKTPSEGGFLGDFFTKALLGPGERASTNLNYYHYFTKSNFDTTIRKCGNQIATKYVLAVRSDEPLSQIPKLYSQSEGCANGSDDWCSNYYCITSNY